MRLVSLGDTAGALRVGAVMDERVYCFSPADFSSMQDLIESVGQGDAYPIASATSALALDEVTVLSPLPNPPRIFCIGLNYASHAEESKMQVQKVPTVLGRRMTTPQEIAAVVVFLLSPTQSAHTTVHQIVVDGATCTWTGPSQQDKVRSGRSTPYIAVETSHRNAFARKRSCSAA